jgi:hypothetical protein
MTGVEIARSEPMTKTQRTTTIMAVLMILAVGWGATRTVGAPPDQSNDRVTHKWNVYSPSNPATNPWSFEAESLSVSGGALVFMQTRDGSLVPTAVIPAIGYSHAEIVN